LEEEQLATFLSLRKYWTGGEYSSIILYTLIASLDSAEEVYLLPLNWMAEAFPLLQQPQFSYRKGISLCSFKHSFTWKVLCGTYCKCRAITQLLSSDVGM